MAARGWGSGQREATALVRCLRPHAHLRVFVPSRNRSGRPLAPRKLIDRVNESLMAIAGGTTTFDGSGVWVNGSGHPLKERITVVESYLPGRLSRSVKRTLVNLLSRIAAEANQEALAVAVNGRMFLIAPNNKE